MMLLAAAAPILLTLADVSILACDAEWMDPKNLEQMVGAELNDLDLSQLQDEIWMMDQCTNVSARIRKFGQNGRKERIVSLTKIPPELKLRTVVLALGDLAREQESTLPSETNETSLNKKAPPAKDEPDTTLEFAVPRLEPPLHPATSTSKPIPVTAEKPRPVGNTNEAIPNSSTNIEVSAAFRWFPLTDTYTPEARLGIRRTIWRFSLGGFGMHWTSSIGKTYLTAITALIGPNLWHYRAAVDVGLDALMELGGAFVSAKASVDLDTTTRFNVTAGGHLALWLNPLPSKKVQLFVFAQAGWLRGINVYAGNVFQGGFEGLSAAFGAALSR